MPTSQAGGTPQTFGVTDYLMSFKKPGNQAAVKAFYDLYYQPDQVNQFIKEEGFLPVTKSGLTVFASDPKLKVSLATLPNIHLTPTDDPAWDKVKLAVQQNIGAGVDASGDPQAVLTSLQKTARTDTPSPWLKPAADRRPCSRAAISASRATSRPLRSTTWSPTVARSSTLASRRPEDASAEVRLRAVTQRRAA